MPFIGNAGQFSNIYEKNYETTTLRVVEGDAAYQAYNPADSHYKLITNLQEITDTGNVTSNTLQFSNAITGFTTTSNVGIANSTPTHTLDVGSKAYIDENDSNTFWTSGTLYADKVLSETTEITNSVTTRDVLADKFFPKTNGFIEVTSNVGVLNTAPVHTLDIGANVQIDEYGSNTFWTSGNVYSEHYKGSNVTVSGSVDTDQLIVNDINSKDTDFVNFTSNVGVLNTAPVHTLDIGANVQIDEYGSNTFWTSGNVYANVYTGAEIQLSGVIRATEFILTGGSQATPTPDIQAISEVLASGGGVPFSSDRTLTLSNVTTALDATVIQALTVNSNLIGNNVTAVTVNSNVIAGNVTVDNNLIVNTDDLVVDTVNSRVGINKASPAKDLDVTGEIECSSHLTVGGDISGNGDAVFRKYTIASPGSGQYSVIGPGFDTATVNPTLTLMRGQKYVFNNTVHGSHPLEIRDGYDGNAYMDGVSGSGTSTITFTVPMDAPLKLYYQCTQHSVMGNIIYIPESTLDTTLALNLSNNLVVTGSSKVGIGTTSPDLELHVHDANNTNSGIVLSSTSSYHRLYDSGGQLYFQSGTAATADSRADINFTSMYNSTSYMKIQGSNGNVGIGSSSPSQKLDVDGSIQHKGLVTTSGTNIDQITSITKTLGVNVSWMDTGIKGTDLVTGSYIVQIENHSDPSGGGTTRNYNEYYTGFMSWYSESNGTNDTDASEIILHAAGHATEDNHIYLRVLRQLNNADLKLQIRRDFDRSNQSVDYKFKFRRMM